MATVGWRALASSLVRLLSSRRQYPESGGQKTPRILAILAKGPNQLLLQTLSQHAGWTLTLSETPPDVASGRPTDVSPIIIYDREQSPDHWRDVVGVLSKSSPRPYIILLSPNSDANLWDELQRVGGSDIVRTPIDRDRLLWAIKRAWLLLRNQQQVRSPLPNRL